MENYEAGMALDLYVKYPDWRSWFYWICTESQDEMNRWQATTEPPPPIEPNMNKLVEAQLDVTVHTFYKEFLSDEVLHFLH